MDTRRELRAQIFFPRHARLSSRFTLIGGTTNAKANAQRIIERRTLHHTENTLPIDEDRKLLAQIYALRAVAKGIWGKESHPFMFASDREARVVFVSPHLVTELGIGPRTHPKTSTALLGRWGFSWRDAKRGNLPAAAGYVGQAGGAKACEIAGQFSTK